MQEGHRAEAAHEGERGGAGHRKPRLREAQAFADLKARESNHVDRYHAQHRATQTPPRFDEIAMPGAGDHEEAVNGEAGLDQIVDDPDRAAHLLTR